MPAKTAKRARPRTGAVKVKAKAKAPGRSDRGRVQAHVLAWFDEHGRSFPWRETRDPYRTMVAEVMLQQTQTGRVAPAYGTFLARFPTLERLARAPAIDVIQAWRGLGYNRRAIDLQRTAQTVAGEHGGVFPLNPSALRRLPGLGEYTANAIACFAFDAQVPVVDTNVRRVLARSALGRDAAEVPAVKTQALAQDWLAPGEAYRWNQALMDIGAMICRVTGPLCATCPLRASCVYRAKGRHKKEPVRARRPGEPFEGSRRQVRGSIVDHLRRAARKGITLGALSNQMHPNGDGDVRALVEILSRLEAEGLAELSPAARKGSGRGLVRLPVKTRRPR
jgi:A/G-specific adenine glycosylase